MNYYYVSSILLTELIMIAMTIHVIKYSGFTKNQKKWYIFTFASVMICSLAEFAVHCGAYDKVFAIPLTILTVLQFSIAPLLGLFFVSALGIKTNKYAFIGSFAFNLILETIAAIFGWIFYFDIEGYHRGPAFLIYEIEFGVSLAYLLISMIIVGKRFKNRDIFTIVMVMIIIVAGIIPMAIFKINITYTAIAIAASLCYIYYNDLVQQNIQAELITNQQKIYAMQEHMISGLANMIENRDLETGGHIFRTSFYVRTLAENARRDGVYADKIDDEFINLMQSLSPLHDIGKILISDNILQKPGKLTKEEFEQMKKHASKGGAVVHEILYGVTDDDYLSFASDIATYQHEWWDGSGYPSGLKGEEIPLSARIMAIADVYDALISKRCYKDAMPKDKAFEIIKEESGTHFDPKLVEVFINHKEDFLKID